MPNTHTTPEGAVEVNGNPVAPQPQLLQNNQPPVAQNLSPAPPLLETPQTFTASQLADAVSRERQAQFTELATARAAASQAQSQAERAEAASAALRAEAAVSVTANADDAQVRQLAELTQEMAALRKQTVEMEAARKQQEHAAEMAGYRSKRLSELKQAGVQVVEALVSGDSREAIEAAIQVANAEYTLLQQSWRAAQPAPTAYAKAPAQAPAQIPAPTVVNPAPVTQQGVTVQNISQMTSPEAVRDGSYEKNRDLILAQLRQGPPQTQTQIPMRPFTQAEPVQQAYTQPAPVQQAYAQPAPVQQAYTQPAPVQQAYTQPAPVQQTYTQPAPVQQPAGVVDAQMLAAEAAHRALTNPQASAASADVPGGLSAAPGYTFGQHNPNAPSAQQLNSGAHPQFRNT